MALPVALINLRNTSERSLFHLSTKTIDSLGEACLKMGDKSGARRYYKKSLELNPDNDNAKTMLKQLEKK